MSVKSCFTLPVWDFQTDQEQTNAVVLRYLTLEKFVSLLKFNAMWFSRLGALQDEFEGTDPQGPRAKLLQIPNSAQLLNRLEQGRSVDPARIGCVVSCWFLGENESLEMWSEYGENGKGVAIRSTIKRLSTSFYIAGDFAMISAVGRVKYVNFESHDMGNDAVSVLRVAFLKDKKRFDWEQEARIVTTNGLHNGCLNPDGSSVSGYKFDPHCKGFHIKCNLQELVQKVIVGSNADVERFNLIKELVGKHNLILEKSKLNSFSSQ
jgi:hypothetical protein